MGFLNKPNSEKKKNHFHKRGLQLSKLITYIEPGNRKVANFFPKMTLMYIK